MNKKNVVNFAPMGAKRKRSVPSYVKILVVLFVTAFVASVSVILAMNDFDIGKALGARQPEEDVSSEETTVSSGEALENMNFEGSLTFLLLCTEEKELTFCQLVSVDIGSNKIRIKPVTVDYTLDTPTGEMTVGEIFSSQSMSVLAALFSSKHINIKNYVHVTEENFRRMMSKLGTVPVEVDGFYEFNVDAVKYTFSPGIQNMTSDILLKYMKYAATDGGALRLQANAVASVFRQHFTMENFSKGEDFFSELINLVDTNITAFDYSSATAVLSLMLSGTPEITVIS